MNNQFAYIDIKEPSDKEIKMYHLDMKLAETESKHIVYPYLHGDMVELSNKVQYDYLVIGSHRRNSKVPSETERINNMKNASCKRPARFVISRDDRVWADNTHWTLSFILNNQSACIKDVPSYIVDFRNEVPTIININHSVYDSVSCILNAIECAYAIQKRLDNGWRPISIKFTINDLLNELFQQEEN